jgi:hypothetical protein
MAKIQHVKSLRLNSWTIGRVEEIEMWEIDCNAHEEIINFMCEQ